MISNRSYIMTSAQNFIYEFGVEVIIYDLFEVVYIRPVLWSRAQGPGNRQLSLFDLNKSPFAFSSPFSDCYARSFCSIAVKRNISGNKLGLFKGIAAIYHSTGVVVFFSGSDQIT